MDFLLPLSLLANICFTFCLLAIIYKLQDILDKLTDNTVATTIKNKSKKNHIREKEIVENNSLIIENKLDEDVEEVTYLDDLDNVKDELDIDIAKYRAAKNNISSDINISTADVLADTKTKLLENGIAMSNNFRTTLLGKTKDAKSQKFVDAVFNGLNDVLSDHFNSGEEGKCDKDKVMDDKNENQ